MSPPRFTLVTVADVDAEAVHAFQEYEAAVLPLLAHHGGRLERRLRDRTGTAEVHVVSFPGREDYLSYQDDPDRLRHRKRLDGLAVQQRTLEVTEVLD